MFKFFDGVFHKLKLAKMKFAPFTSPAQLHMTTMAIVDKYTIANESLKSFIKKNSIENP